MLDRLQNRSIAPSEVPGSLDVILEAVLHLSPDNTELNYTLGLLEVVLGRYAHMNGLQANRYRVALAYLDERWFG